MTIAGKMTIPAGIIIFPAGKVSNLFIVSRLRFCRGRGCGRIDIVVTAHLAAYGPQLLGFGRVFAKQAHHGVNRAAGVRIGVVGCGLHRNGLILLLHIQIFLEDGKVADTFNFALQPRDVRGRVEVFRLQRRLIVGVLHIGDDFVDDPDFFSDCVHRFFIFSLFVPVYPDVVLSYQKAKIALTLGCPKLTIFCHRMPRAKTEIWKTKKQKPEVRVQKSEGRS